MVALPSGPACAIAGGAASKRRIASAHFRHPRDVCDVTDIRAEVQPGGPPPCPRSMRVEEEAKRLVEQLRAGDNARQARAVVAL